MRLNLPIAEAVSECKTILIAGMGGGFDVFCGLPVYFELQQQGKDVHLANFSFSNILSYKDGIELSETLKGVTTKGGEYTVYFPELYLARWFAEELQEETVIWCFQKTGARPLLENYRILRDHLDADCILLIDGGVDSLIRGDEPGTGTLIEDATSLYAVNQVNEVPVRIVGCVGLGVEPDLTYYHIFENIAQLTAAGGFLGSCALAPGMKACELYREAVAYVQGMPLQDPSVVNSSIISAVEGHYADHHLTEKTRGSRLWISPLMALYWFFDLPAVAGQNLYLSSLRNTETFFEALRSYMTFVENARRRPWQGVPLP